MLFTYLGGHSGAMVTHSTPNSKVSGSNPGPYVAKLVVAYQWSAVYSAVTFTISQLSKSLVASNLFFLQYLFNMFFFLFGIRF